MASFSKRNSKWQYRVSYKDANGKYRNKTKGGFDTKKEAQLAASVVEEKFSRGMNTNPEKIIFIDYFEEWYKLYKKPFISDKTKNNYRISIDVARNFFGKMSIAEITEDLYQQFINNYAKDPKTGKRRSKETVAKVNVHVKACLKKAVKSGILSFNPGDDVVIGGYEKSLKERNNYLSENEQLKLTQEIVKGLSPRQVSPYIVLFSLATGVRFSEAIGLTWDCVDFKAGTVNINETWDLTKNDFAPTKNEASNRIITVDDLTLHYLKPLKIHQDRFKLNYNNLVFSVKGAGPPSNNSVNKSLERALRRANVKKTITHHGLRHTHVSFLLFKEVNIKYISRRIGHATVSTTLDDYSHIIDEMEQKQSIKVNELMKSTYPTLKQLNS